MRFAFAAVDAPPIAADDADVAAAADDGGEEGGADAAVDLGLPSVPQHSAIARRAG